MRGGGGGVEQGWRRGGGGSSMRLPIRSGSVGPGKNDVISLCFHISLPTSEMSTSCVSC